MSLRYNLRLNTRPNERDDRGCFEIPGMEIDTIAHDLKTTTFHFGDERICYFNYQINRYQQIKMSRSPITCHILDTTIGKPASGVNCAIYHLPNETSSQDEVRFALLKTNDDGRIANWVVDPSIRNTEFGIDDEGNWKLKLGFYKIRFQVGSYLSKNGGKSGFFPFIDVNFIVEDPEQHYHIPLLLSNHSYTTYRGS